MSARLLCRTGELAGLTFDLTGEDTVGRGGWNSIVLHPSVISEEHASIRLADGQYVLEDLGSRNGTQLDGVPVTAPVTLGGLHVITFGVCDFVFVHQVSGGQADTAESRTQASPETQAVPPPMRGNMGAAPTPVPSSRAPTTPEPSDGPSTGVQEAAFPTLPELPPADRVEPKSSPPPETVLGMPALGAVDLGDLVSATETAPEDLQGGAEGAAKAAPTEPAAQLPDQARYYLEIQLDLNNKVVHPLKNGRNTIGRADDCDVTVNDGWLSRWHAIVWVGDSIVLEDLASGNGTFLNRERVERADLKAGDVFTIGPTIQARLIRR